MENLHTSNSYDNSKDVSEIFRLTRLLNSLKEVNLSSDDFKDAYNNNLHELSVTSQRVLKSYGYTLEDRITYGNYSVEDIRTGRMVNDFVYPKTMLSYSNGKMNERHISKDIAIYFVCQALDIELDLKC
jgi:hypothetical protein